MTKSGFTLAVGLLLLGPAAPCAAQESAKIADAIRADAAKLVAQLNAHDAAGAVSHDAPDVVAMFHGLPNAEGPEADLTVTRMLLSDPLAHVAVSDERVDVAASGEMAVYRASYTLTMTDPKTKGPMTEHGNWVVGYRLQPDGTWKIAWDVVSDT
jgi:ketosteroid isomerase-like protein